MIGGAAAAQVVFSREVESRARQAKAFKDAEAAYERTPRQAARVARDQAFSEALLAARLEIAAEFDAIHSVERARDVGSLHDIVSPENLRSYLVDSLRRVSPDG